MAPFAASFVLVSCAEKVASCMYYTVCTFLPHETHNNEVAYCNVSGAIHTRLMAI